ncbi:MAG: LacI family DNA-binding transcriptional regulator [Trueperaceae bacterium]
MPKVSATLHDVARHASVGISTVSKVLNNYQDIAPETRERVLRSVEELSYTPNRAARSFRTGKTNTVSIFMPMIGTDFYDRLVTAMDEELAAHDFDAALFPLLNPRRLERYKAPDALPYHADGLIFASLNPDWLFTDARLPVGLPAVLVDAYHESYDTISVDNAGGAYAATAHLLERPAPTFAILVEERFDTPFSSGVFLERRKGFERALREHGLEPGEDRVLNVEFGADGGRTAFRQILERARPPLNIFSSCDLLARSVLDEASRLDLQLGEDVRVVGFDDQPWAKGLGLSSVHQPVERMGRLAIKMLLERLTDSALEARHQEIEPTLVVRGSSGGG